MTRYATALVVLLAVAAPAAAEFRNAQSTPFGSVTLPAYLPGRGPVDLEARIHVNDPAGLPADGHLLVGLSTQDPTAHVRLDAVTLPDGTPLPIQPTSSSSEAAPRVTVPVAALAGSSDVVVRGKAWADENGRFHVGALVVAFTGDWSPVVTPDGETAQAYGFTWLGARQLTGAAGPFSGQGNDVAALLPAFGLMAVCAFLWWLSRRPAKPRRMRAAKGQFVRGPQILTAPPMAREPRMQRPALPRPTWQTRRPPAARGAHPVRLTGRAPPVRTTVAPFPNPMPRPRPPQGPPEHEPAPRPRGPLPGLGPRRPAAAARPPRPPSLRSGAATPPRPGALR